MIIVSKKVNLKINIKLQLKKYNHCQKKIKILVALYSGLVLSSTLSKQTSKKK